MKDFNPVKLRFSKLIAPIINTILHPFSPNKTVKSDEDPKSILIVEAAMIGDLVLASSTIHTLRKRFLNSKISVLIHSDSQTLLNKNTSNLNLEVVDFPWVKGSTKIINWLNLIKRAYDLRNKYEWVVHLRGDIRDIWFTSFLNAERVFSSVYSGGEKFVTDHITTSSNVIHQEEDNILVAEKFGCRVNKEDFKPFFEYPISEKKSNAERKLVGISVGGSTIEKQYPFDKTLKLISILSHDCDTIFFASSKDEEALYKENGCTTFYNSDLSKTSIEISKCNYFISTDSALMHLASWFHLPQVVLFGKTPLFLTRPRYGLLKVLQNKLGLSYIEPLKIIETLAELSKTELKSELQRLQ